MPSYWLSFGTREVCAGIMIVEAETIGAATLRAAELVPDQQLVTGWTLDPQTPEGERLLVLLPRDELISRDEVRRLEKIADRRPD
jgi:hypothetical protein